MLYLLLIVVLAAAIACLWNRGIWGASLTLINIMFAALLAMNFFEPLAQKLGDKNSNMMDFLCLWGLFAVFFAVFRLATDLVSRVRVRFPPLVDLIGAVFLAIWGGWILYCFTLTSLHASPLARSPLIGSFMTSPTEKMVAGTAPDRLWLAFTRQVSLGAFSNGAEGFDPRGEFVFKYAARRQADYEIKKIKK
jgi:hypothetical protein